MKNNRKRKRESKAIVSRLAGPKRYSQEVEPDPDKGRLLRSGEAGVTMQSPGQAGRGAALARAPVRAGGQ